MKTTQKKSKDFLISDGGPLYNTLTRIPLFNTQKRLAVLGLCLTWLPLVVISGLEGTLFSGVEMPFLYDIAMQARVLIALPMLIIIRVAIDGKVRAVINHFGTTLLSPEEREYIINTTFRRAKKLTSSALTEIIFLLLVIIATVSLVKGGVYSGLESGMTTWMATENEGGQTLSFAGYWSVFVSIPLFQFFLLRWFWRYIVWTLLLFRLSKTNLQLLPTHADKSGGLGIILLAQRSFALLFVCNSIVISGQFTQQLLNHPDTFMSIRSVVFGYIAVSIIILLFPLIFFAGKLLEVKNNGLLTLGKLGADLSRRFEHEWLSDATIEKKSEEEQIDPSMIYDYSGIYESLQQLRVVPVTARDIAGLAILLFIPFVPILFIHFSVAELLQRITGMLL